MWMFCINFLSDQLNRRISELAVFAVSSESQYFNEDILSGKLIFVYLLMRGS